MTIAPTLICDDGNGNVVFVKDIEFTDFPLSEITLWFGNNTIYLPSEGSQLQDGSLLFLPRNF